MIFITEHIIEQASEVLDIPEDEWLITVEGFGKSQPAILAYLFSEDLELLTQEEREYGLYLTMVIWKSIETVVGKCREVTAEEIANLEEFNWVLLEGVNEKRFRDRMTVFFDGYVQEDLLAFVEDALVDDEDSQVSKEGREPLFVTLKSIIDALSIASEG
jgi:hypothetical protein